jgi:hypothetical protein
MCTYKTEHCNPNSITLLAPDRSQHDLPASRVIAQQYSSATFISLRVHTRNEKVGAHFKTLLKKCCNCVSLKLCRSRSDRITSANSLTRFPYFFSQRPMPQSCVRDSTCSGHKNPPPNKTGCSQLHPDTVLGSCGS